MDWAPQAIPQTAEEALQMPRHPEIVTMARGRAISSVVHFTRISGLVGILDSSVVKARSNLPSEERLEHVYAPNAEYRNRDLQWHGYVNLSVTKINVSMLNYSRNWHPNDKWVILGFNPELLGDPGVIFCTTNNAYGVAHRCAGPRGFEQMFASEVPWGYHGYVHTRYGRNQNQTTDPQAEVLYPFELSTGYLNTITVSDEETEESVIAASSHFPSYDNVDLALNPKAFQ